jgi:hypothetical protein
VTSLRQVRVRSPRIATAQLGACTSDHHHHHHHHLLLRPATEQNHEYQSSI